MNLGKFGQNALLYSIGTIALRTASFVLIPIYTYSLAVRDYGFLAVLLQTAQIMMTVMSLGSRTAMVRFAKEYENKNQFATLLGTSIFINFAGAVAVTIIAIVFLSPLFKAVLHAETVLGYILLTCLAATFNCLSLHLVSYYRAGQDGAKVIFANLSGAVSLIVLTMILLRAFDLGVLGALLAQVIIYGCLSGFLFIVVVSKTGIALSLSLARDLIRFGLPLIVVMTGGLITQASGLYFLSYFRGLEEVGIYSLGSKIAQIAEMVLILPFVMAYEPFVYSHIRDSQLWATISRLLTYLMTGFAFVACGIVFVARDLVSLIAPPAYKSAYFVIFLILPALAFRGVYYIGESLLLLEKKTGLVGMVIMMITAVSVALNYAFIWLWGMYGAVGVFAFTTVCTGAAILKLGLGMSFVRIETERLFVTAMLLFAFLATVYALRDASDYLYYSLVPAGVCAGTLLLYASNFTKEDERRAIHEFFGRAHKTLFPRNV